MIGLYIAFILPVFLRWRKGDNWDEPRAWSLGKWYKWIDSIAILWVALVTVLFIFPLYKAGLPWESDFAWELTNYTIIWFAGIGLDLRRLVGPLGRRTGSRARSAWAPRRSWSGTRRSSRSERGLPAPAGS